MLSLHVLPLYRHPVP